MATTTPVPETFALDTQLACAKDSVLTTLSSACSTEACYAGNDNETCPYDGIAGIISLVGDISWSLMWTFPQQVATQLAVRFAGFDIDYGSDDMTDVVGELANVLAGEALARLDALGVKATMGLPMVVRGTNLNLMLPDGTPRIHMRFSCDEGPFYLILGAREQA